MKFIITTTVFLLLLLLAIAFGAQNEQLVTVNYLIAQAQMPLSSLMAICILVGILLALLLYSVVFLRLKLRIMKLKRQARNLQTETER